MFENVIIRIGIIVFRDFMTLVKYEQILSLFNQPYYYTNYYIFSALISSRCLPCIFVAISVESVSTLETFGVLIFGPSGEVFNEAIPSKRSSK